MCEYDSYEYDDMFGSGDSWDAGEGYDPEADYRLCDCTCTEDEDGEPVWLLCDTCVLTQKCAVARCFPSEVAYVHTAIVRILGSRDTATATLIARAFLRYVVSDAPEFLATSAAYRALVRSKCAEWSDGPMGSSLRDDIKAAQKAVEGPVATDLVQ
jgi:hypothetical protein